MLLSLVGERGAIRVSIERLFIRSIIQLIIYGRGGIFFHLILDARPES